MKKFPGKILLKVILKERCFVEHVKEQYKNDKRKELPPKPVRLRPVLSQRLAAKQKTFRNKKDSAGFGWFPGRNNGRKKNNVLYIPGKLRDRAKQHTGKQDEKEKTQVTWTIQPDHQKHCITRKKLDQ
jgi:hypothetical protein